MSPPCLRQAFESSKNSVLLPTHTLDDCLHFSVFLKASAASVANFVFIDSNLRYYNRQLTAAKMYLISWLYLENLST